MSVEGDEEEMEDVGESQEDFFDHEPSRHEKIEVSLQIMLFRWNLAYHIIELLIKRLRLLEIPAKRLRPQGLGTNSTCALRRFFDFRISCSLFLPERV